MSLIFLIVFKVEVAVALLKDGILTCIWAKNIGSLMVPTMKIITQETKRIAKFEVRSVAVIAINPKI
jgi:hypothetical protein